MKPLPAVSVVVPVRNGARLIEACIRSLLDQDYPRDRVQLLVVDNGSTDRTEILCSRMGVTPLSEPRPGAARARNRGLAEARGSIVAFTDADCVVPPNWLRSIAASLESAEAVTGWILPAEGTGRLGLARARLHREYQSECRKLGSQGLLDRLDTANAAAWRQVVEEAGGFDPRVFFVEDRELGARIADRGARIAFQDAPAVGHRYEEQLLPSMHKARETGRMWARMAQFLPPDYFHRRFPDVLARLEATADSSRRWTSRPRTALHYRIRLLASSVAGAPEHRFRHYRNALVLAVRLGMLDVLATPPKASAS